MKSSHFKCIVCATDFETESGTSVKNVCDIFQRIWTSFLKHFNVNPSKWQDLFEYYIQIEIIPFCWSCRVNLGQIVVLEDQISKEVETISLKLVESSSNFDLGDVVNCHQNSDGSNNELVKNRITSLRDKIIQDLTPQVRRLVDSQKDDPSSSPTTIKDDPIFHDLSNNFFDDEISTKQDEDCQIVQDYCHSPTMKFEKIHIKTEQNETELEINNDDDNNVQYKPRSIPRKRMKKTNIQRRKSSRRNGMSSFLTHKCGCEKSGTVHKKHVIGKKKNMLKKESLGDGQFTYGGFAYEKTNGNKFWCATCGTWMNALYKMKTHIRYSHVQQNPPETEAKEPSEVTYSLPGSVAKDLGNGQYLYYPFSYNMETEDNYPESSLTYPESSSSSNHSWRTMSDGVEKKRLVGDKSSWETVHKNISKIEGPGTSTETGFSCNFCSTAFRLHSQAARHVRIVHLNQRKVCQDCGRGFYDGRNLKNHMMVCKGPIDMEATGGMKKQGSQEKQSRHRPKSSKETSNDIEI